NLSQIPGRGVQPATGSLGEGGDLRSRRFQQIKEIIQAGDGEDVATIPGTFQQAFLRVKGEGVDDVLMRAPQPSWRTGGRNAIDVGATAGAPARKRKWACRRGRGGRGIDRHAWN